MELKVSEQQVAELVTQGLLKAGLENHLAKSINSVLSGYDNPLDKAIRLLVGEIANKILRETYRERIESIVKDYITKNVTEELMEKTINEATKRMIKAAEDRSY